MYNLKKIKNVKCLTDKNAVLCVHTASRFAATDQLRQVPYYQPDSHYDSAY